ncbi:hypothetical protein ILUMI_02720 [Ignelater luminosus]|uniref:Kazal-like domain-containing protein n=1 Tax=Ignelater luminosus TaxID=2038154 RepID=A0A8K0DHR3_IGNLU|nr:hypothetical protein ILUMI_02720 [Ignelater luminosus]
MTHLTIYLFAIVIAHQAVFISSQRIVFLDDDLRNEVVTRASRQMSTPVDIGIARCVASCKTLPQYDPVCGSDGVSYHNVYKLRCAQRCGKRIRPLYRAACSPSTTSKSTSGGK